MDRGSSLPSPDHFVAGMNLPWVNYGGDFGANAWRPTGGISAPPQRDVARRALADIAAAGASVVRWFVLCDGRAGLRTDAGGAVRGLDDFVFRDMDTALDLATEAGLRLLFVLFDFSWCHRAREHHGVTLGGRRRTLVDRDEARRVIDHIVTPIAIRYGSHPALWAWDVINEPEWITRGVNWRNPFRAVSRAGMQAFIIDSVAALRAHATQPVTVGSASGASLSLVEPCALDFYQVHWYDRFESQAPLDRDASILAAACPVVLGEFPTRGSCRSARQIFEIARARNFAGAFPWSWMATDVATDAQEAAAALRPGVFSTSRILERSASD